MYRYAQRRRRASDSGRVWLLVSTMKGVVRARTVPYSGIVTCISDSSSSRNASNSASALSISSMSSTVGSALRMDLSSGRSRRYSSPNRSDMPSAPI